MNRRRIVRTAGATAGGLIGVALLPAVLAVADSFSYNPGTYTFEPIAPEKITGVYNLTTAPPDVSESIQGYQQFDVLNASGTSIGTFSAYNTTYPYLNPNPTTQVILVSPDVPNSANDGTVPPDGSIYASYGNPDFIQNVYFSTPSTGGGRHGQGLSGDPAG